MIKRCRCLTSRASMLKRSSGSNRAVSCWLLDDTTSKQLKQHFSAFGHPPSYLSLPSLLPFLRALCVLSIIKEKAEREGARSAGRSVRLLLAWPSSLPYFLYPSISHVHVDGCMVAVERERTNKARLRVPNLQSDQPIAGKLIPFFFFGC